MVERVDVVLVGRDGALRTVARELRRSGHTAAVFDSVATVRPCCGAWEVEAAGTVWFARAVVGPSVPDARALLDAVRADLARRPQGLG
jgi:hypothetical protein